MYKNTFLQSVELEILLFYKHKQILHGYIFLYIMLKQVVY